MNKRLHSWAAIALLALVVAACGNLPWQEGAKAALAFDNIEHYYELDKPLDLLSRADLTVSEIDHLKIAAGVANSVMAEVDRLQDDPKQMLGKLVVIRSEYARVRSVYESLYEIFDRHKQEYDAETLAKLAAFHRDVKIFDKEMQALLVAADQSAALSKTGETVGLLLRAAVLRL